MAVSVDTVYQRVLVLANKEQRGYITPQEFNLLANHAQMEIFDQYFFDIKQAEKITQLQSNQEYSDPITMLYEKIGAFEIERDNAWMVANMPTTSDQYMLIPSEVYKLGTIKLNNINVELVNSKDFDLARLSALTSPTLNRPIAYITSSGLSVAFSANDFAIPLTHLMNINYMKKPRKVEWAYVIVNDKPLYNANIAVDFELHGSEETRLVYKILKLAGINLKAKELVQVGQTLEVEKLQQEKQ